MRALIAVACLYGSLCIAAEAARALDAPPTRAQIIGAWRLISIETTNRRGRTLDAFFEPGSSGLIVYDASGWMSVQIAGPLRVSWEVPDARSPAQLHSHLRLKAAAYDSYYAYYGSWDYDQASGVMTHHVKSSVIPAEAGLDYAQFISVEGSRMTFTGHGRDRGGEFTRTKVWERVGAP